MIPKLSLNGLRIRVVCYSSAMLLAGLLSAPTQAADGTMIRDDRLHAAASSTSSVVGQAAKGSVVEILERKGGWTRIRAGGKSGWVRLLSIRAFAGGGSGGDDLGGVVALTQKRDAGRVVAVAGLRGLNEEELRAAQFDARELQRLESHAVSSAEARRFAVEAGLSSQALNYLPAPKQDEPKMNTNWPWGGY